MKKNKIKKIIASLAALFLLAASALYGQLYWDYSKNGSFDLMIGCIGASDPISAAICKSILKKQYLTPDIVSQLNQDAGMTHVIFIPDQKEREVLLELLLSRGVDINSTTNRHGSKATALHIAALSGDVEAVQLLLKYGAKTDARDASNRTPADLADAEVKKYPENNNYSAVEKLLKIQ